MPWYKKKSLSLQPETTTNANKELVVAGIMANKDDVLKKMSEAELRAEVLRLQQELSQANLKVEALDTMIDLAEQQEGIRIRKKSGAKRS